MARNPFWDVAMNRNKFSACLTTQTLENQSSLNQNFVKSCWMSAEGYWFFFFNRSLSEKSRKLSNLIKVKEVFLNHCFFKNFCESTPETCWSNVQSVTTFKSKVRISCSVMQRPKEIRNRVWWRHPDLYYLLGSFVSCNE